MVDIGTGSRVRYGNDELEYLERLEYLDGWLSPFRPESDLKSTR